SSWIFAIRDCISWACFNKSPIAPMLAILVPPDTDAPSALGATLLIFPADIAHRSTENAQCLFDHRATLVAATPRGRFGVTGNAVRNHVNDLHVNVLSKKPAGLLLKRGKIVAIEQEGQMMALGHADSQPPGRHLQRFTGFEMGS